jgi:hypothetical protein
MWGMQFLLRSGVGAPIDRFCRLRMLRLADGDPAAVPAGPA